MNYLSAQYPKNHFMKHFPTLWLIPRNFLGIRWHFSVVSLVFKAHHLGAMWIICLHNISRTTWWIIFLLCGCFFGCFSGFDYIWNLRNLCILVEHAPGVGHTATELVPASGDECYLLMFSWAVSPHVPPPPPGDSIDWCIIDWRWWAWTVLQCIGAWLW